MKKIFTLVVCALIASSLVFAQKTEKEMKKELKDKATKEAQKEAKKLTKEGWKVNPGSLPLDKMVEQAWMKQVAEDDQGKPMYLMADGNGVAESKTVAEAQAIETAKLQLAGTLESNIASLVKLNLGNTQISTQDAASVTEIVQSSKSVLAQQLGYIDPAFKIYRNLKENKIEVQVRLFYETKQTILVAKKAIRKDLKDKLNKTDQEVDKLLQDQK
jgi:hypothetical protein